MKISSEKIMTTHVGSLPRPHALAEVMTAKDQGELPSTSRPISEMVKDAVADIVKMQAKTGIDIINDGEMSKFGYATYVCERLTGFEGSPNTELNIWDLNDVPELAKRALVGFNPSTPSCTGPIEFKGREFVQEDISNLRKSMENTGVTEAFMNAASPGIISIYLNNKYYQSEEAYLEALAEAMRQEYEMISEAGFILQIDCPELAIGLHVGKRILSVEEFRKKIALHIDILNYATRNIPSDRMRIHICWGNYESPHHYDVPLRDIVDIILKTRAQAILFEAANPRHEHEWRVFEDVKLPDDKVLVPGVIDTCTNYVEHPDLVADRIVRFADIVGRERVMAGTDCGFATFASFQPVEPKVSWMKLNSLVVGASIATKRLWQ